MSAEKANSPVPLHGLLVALCGGAAGAFIYAALGEWSRKSLIDPYFFIWLQCGALFFLLLWLLYSALMARILGRDAKVFRRADAYSYLPSFILLIYLYLSQFPTHFSTYHLMRTLPVAAGVALVVIKVITFLGFRFSSPRLVVIFLLSIVTALLRAIMAEGPWLGEVYSPYFILWWQFYLILILSIWHIYRSLADKEWLKLALWAVCGAFVLWAGGALLVAEKPPTPSLRAIVDKLPPAEPFELIDNAFGLPYRRTRVADEARDALVMPPGEKAVARLKTPPDALLRVGMGIMDAAWEQAGDGALFNVDIETNDGASQRLFSRYLDPKGYPGDRGWLDDFIDLSPFAGLDVKLIFSVEGGAPVSAPFARKPDNRFDFAVWSEPRIIPPPDDRPDVVLITIDTLRRDHLGVYGYHRDTTPNIDAFAEGAAVFERAVSQSPWTLPSMASVFTSLYPSEHGVADLEHLFLDGQFKTLAEVFSENGYETAAFSSTPLIADNTGFGQGFDLFDESCYPFVNYKGAECLTNAALKWINKADRPYFLYLHYYDPHTPYHAPPPYRTMFDPDYEPDDLYLALGEVQQFDQKIIFFGRNSLTDRQLRYLIALYDGDIRYADHHVGRLLKALENSGNNKVIAIIADHGEEFLEHGGFRHGHTLHAELLNVPFILKLPDKRLAGARIPNLVRLIDLAPTLAAAAGLKPPEGIDGYNLLKIMDNPPGPAMAFSEVKLTQDAYSLRTDAVKYIRILSDRRGNRAEMLYDLRSDPEERHDLKEWEPKLLKTMQKQMDSFIEGLKKPALPNRPVDVEQQKRLKALGYVDN